MRENLYLMVKIDTEILNPYISNNQHFCVCRWESGERKIDKKRERKEKQIIDLCILQFQKLHIRKNVYLMVKKLQWDTEPKPKLKDKKKKSPFKWEKCHAEILNLYFYISSENVFFCACKWERRERKRDKKRKRKEKKWYYNFKNFRS